jgi:hypothetical protein
LFVVHSSSAAAHWQWKDELQLSMQRFWAATASGLRAAMSLMAA